MNIQKNEIKIWSEKSVLVFIENHNMNLPFGQPNLAPHLCFTHWQWRVHLGPK